MKIYLKIFTCMAIIFMILVLCNILFKKKELFLTIFEKNFLVIICRIKDEHYLLPFFVDYYLSQGVDKIYFIDDNSSKPYNIVNEKVEFIQSTLARKRKNQMEDVRNLYHKIKTTTEWIMVIDADEFIHTKGLDTTIRSMLETEFKNVDWVLVPWIMFSFNKRETDSKHLIHDYCWRWNHDKKHPHPNNSFKNRCRYKGIEHKSIFRSSHFKPGNPHSPIPIKKKYTVTDSVYNSKKFRPYHIVRENIINDAFMICNHYRFTSIEAIKRKCNPNAYNIYASMKNCVEDCILSDYPEVYDDRLSKKWKHIQNKMKNK